MIPCNDIGQHLLISVANVRRRVGVIDRGRNEECLRHRRSRCRRRAQRATSMTGVSVVLFASAPKMQNQQPGSENERDEVKPAGVIPDDMGVLNCAWWT